MFNLRKKKLKVAESPSSRRKKKDDSSRRRKKDEPADQASIKKEPEIPYEDPESLRKRSRKSKRPSNRMRKDADSNRAKNDQSSRRKGEQGSNRTRKKPSRNQDKNNEQGSSRYKEPVAPSGKKKDGSEQESGPYARVDFKKLEDPPEHWNKKTPQNQKPRQREPDQIGSRNEEAPDPENPDKPLDEHEADKLREVERLELLIKNNVLKRDRKMKELDAKKEDILKNAANQRKREQEILKAEDKEVAVEPGVMSSKKQKMRNAAVRDVPSSKKGKKKEEEENNNNVAADVDSNRKKEKKSVKGRKKSSKRKRTKRSKNKEEKAPSQTSNQSNYNEKGAMTQINDIIADDMMCKQNEPEFKYDRCRIKDLVERNRPPVVDKPETQETPLPPPPAPPPPPPPPPPCAAAPVPAMRPPAPSVCPTVKKPGSKSINNVNFLPDVSDLKLPGDDKKKAPEPLQEVDSEKRKKQKQLEERNQPIPVLGDVKQAPVCAAQSPGKEKSVPTVYENMPQDPANVACFQKRDGGVTPAARISRKRDSGQENVKAAQIAAYNLVRNEADYPTMNDVVSDWDSREEANPALKAARIAREKKKEEEEAQEALALANEQEEERQKQEEEADRRKRGRKSKPPKQTPKHIAAAAAEERKNKEALAELLDHKAYMRKMGTDVKSTQPSPSDSSKRKNQPSNDSSTPATKEHPVRKLARKKPTKKKVDNSPDAVKAEQERIALLRSHAPRPKVQNRNTYERDIVAGKITQKPHNDPTLNDVNSDWDTLDEPKNLKKP